MSELPQSLTRNQLAEFLPNQRAVRAFERLFKTTGETTPTDVASLKILVEEVSLAASSSGSQAIQALSSLRQLAELLGATSQQPVVQNHATQSTPSTPLQLTLAELADVLVAVSIPGASLIYNSTLRRWVATRILQLVTQVETPSSTGFSITVVSMVSQVVYNVWLLLKPTAGFASGTIVLPLSSTCVDQQEVSVTCTQQVTSLTVNGNGSSVSGAPPVLAADSTFKLRFNQAASTWFRAQ